MRPYCSENSDVFFIVLRYSIRAKPYTPCTCFGPRFGGGRPFSVRAVLERFAVTSVPKLRQVQLGPSAFSLHKLERLVRRGRNTRFVFSPLIVFLLFYSSSVHDGHTQRFAPNVTRKTSRPFVQHRRRPVNRSTKSKWNTSSSNWFAHTHASHIIAFYITDNNNNNNHLRYNYCVVYVSKICILSACACQNE